MYSSKRLLWKAMVAYFEEREHAYMIWDTGKMCWEPVWTFHDLQRRVPTSLVDRESIRTMRMSARRLSTPATVQNVESGIV